MQNKIVMPVHQNFKLGHLATCVPHLAQRKDGDGGDFTVILGGEGQVLFFDAENGTITHGTKDYLLRAFDIIRPYSSGETLAITKG